MVMSRDPGLKFRNFYFSPNFVLNFRKSYQIWEKLAQEQKVTGKKQIGGWKTPPPPVLIGLILINCTLLHHLQDLNHYLPIEYLHIRIENTDLSMKTM